MTRRPRIARRLRTAEKVLREGQRQLHGRRDRHRTGGAPPGHVWLTHRRVPVLARVDPGLQLPGQQQQLAAAVLAAVRARGLDCWSVPQPEGGRRTLGVRAADRAALLDLLADLAGPGWYVLPLRPDGRRAPTWRRLAERPRWPGAPGLVVWEFVTATPAGTFRATADQGLRITFWTPGEEGSDELRCLVQNAVATVLPAAAAASRGAVPAVLARPLTTAVTFPVDVVCTWVDGTDQQWLRSKAEAAGAADPALLTERADDLARFDDHDELRSSLRSLQQFAPWVRHVWVVTADQHPRWLRADDPWVTVVSHRAIWPDPGDLPTFNSHAIEACLHKIPGLAEHFLYLNDDMVLGRPLGPERFFHPSGVGKFFASRALVDFAAPRAGEIASSTAAKNARALLEERFGVTLTRKFFHTAAALTVSGQEALEAEFPAAFAFTRRARFRTVHDVAAAGSLALHHGHVTGRLVPGRLRYTYVDPAEPTARARLERLLRRRDFDAFCVNDGASAETPEQRRRTDRLIRDFLTGYLPVPGTFERPAAEGGPP